MRRSAFLAAAVCLALAVFHTWPLASAPARLSLNDNADAELNAWIVSWIAHAIPTAPTHLFAGNIFQPDDHALVYSDPLVVPALIGAPIRWLGGSAVLTFNLLLLFGLAATAFAGWFVIRTWTGSQMAGLVGGALLAFNTHLLTRLPHLQAAHAWGLVLVLYLADRVVGESGHRDIGASEPRQSASPVRAAVLLGLTLAAVAMTSAYWLVFAGVVIVVSLSGVRSMRSVAWLALACLGAGVLALPVLWPYARFAATGATRPLEVVAQFSATLSGYLVSRSHADFWWGRPWFTNDVNVFFPGITALVLAAVGAIAAIRTGGATRRRALMVVALAGIGVVLSLGPATSIYRTLYAIVPPLRGIRAAARFGYLPLVAVAILAGYGVAAIERRLTTARAAMTAGLIVLAVVSIEAWQGPIITTPFDGIPRVYSLLANAPSPVLLVEVPFYPAEAVFENGEYVLNATSHWQPVMNGYSGFTPDKYRERAATFWFFPEGWAIDAMKREGATHVMVHLEKFGAEGPAVILALDHRADLRLVGADRAGHRLYQFVAGAGNK